MSRVTIFMTHWNNGWVQATLKTNGINFRKGIFKMEKQSGYNSNYRSTSKDKGLVRVEVVVPSKSRGQVLELARQLRQEFRNPVPVKPIPTLQDGSIE